MPQRTHGVSTGRTEVGQHQGDPRPEEAERLQHRGIGDKRRQSFCVQLAGKGQLEPSRPPRHPCSRDALDHRANSNAISVMWPRQYGFGPAGNNHATSPSIGTRTPPRTS